MELTCGRCDEVFDSGVLRNYCDECVAHYEGRHAHAIARANPAPDVHACGKFLPKRDCPESITTEDYMHTHCGLCGSEELESGYGFAGGFGLGSYRYCMDCHAVQDFLPDCE